MKYVLLQTGDFPTFPKSNNSNNPQPQFEILKGWASIHVPNHPKRLLCGTHNVCHFIWLPAAWRFDRHSPFQCTGSKTASQSTGYWEIKLYLLYLKDFVSCYVLVTSPSILDIPWPTLASSSVLAECRVQVVGDLVEVTLRLFHLLHVLPQEDRQVFGNAFVCLVQ